MVRPLSVVQMLYFNLKVLKSFQELKLQSKISIGQRILNALLSIKFNKTFNIYGFKRLISMCFKYSLIGCSLTMLLLSMMTMTADGSLVVSQTVN